MTGAWSWLKRLERTKCLRITRSGGAWLQSEALRRLLVTTPAIRPQSFHHRDTEDTETSQRLCGENSLRADEGSVITAPAAPRAVPVLLMTRHEARQINNRWSMDSREMRCVIL